MTEPTPESAGPPTAGPAPAGQWMAPAYDRHPPAEAEPTGPDGPSHFGGPASAAEADQTTVLPVVDDGPPLVWPELRGTPLIGRFVPLADESVTGNATSAPIAETPRPAALVAAPVPAPPFVAPEAVAPRITDPKPAVVPVEATSVTAAPVAMTVPEQIGAEVTETEAIEAEVAPPAPMDPPTAVIDLVKAEPEAMVAGPAEPEDQAEAMPAAAVDIEPIVAVLTAPEPSADYQPMAEPTDPPTQVVERIEAEPLPEPSASLIAALQAMSPPAAYAPPPAPAYAPPVAYAAPMAYAQAYSPPPQPQAPMWAPPVQRSRATQSVTCPQCGTVVPVDPQSRSSLDFCPNPVCDFPLFWVKSAIIADATSYGDGASHRRLPGTAGRAVAASMACPHCTEPNPLSGVVCVRCGLDLRPIAVAPPPPPPPAPEPVYIAQEIDDPINWWLIILVGALIVLFFAALAFVAVAYLTD